MKRTRCIVIGLDCATPNLVFDRFKKHMPHLHSLAKSGIAGLLRSTDPPITVPAWSAMMTSKDPGQLGFYGFRNRSGYNYDELEFASSANVKEKTIWNYLSRARKSSLIVGVPQTYPPKPMRGVMACSFLTPSKDVVWTYPSDAAAKIDAAAGGEYIIDVRDFRTNDKARLKEQIFEMTRRRFRAFRTLLDEGHDFNMMVEMGLDRLHHSFWRFMDEGHRLHEPGSLWKDVIRDYHILLDEEIASVCKKADDNTALMIVSDHGAKRMVGAIAINELFIETDLLTLKEKVHSPCSLQPHMVDWDKTFCWGEGGYYSRVFFNIKDREPKGQVAMGEVAELRERVTEILEGIRDEKGNLIGTRVLVPEEIYREVNGISPDLIAYLGNLDWRSSARVGIEGIHLFENDTGPDDANHDFDGIFVYKPRSGHKVVPKSRYSIYDIAPTILDGFGLRIPSDMIGTSCLSR